MESIITNESALTLSTLKGYSENFIDYLDVDNKTLKAYKVGIENFMDYLKENGIKMPVRNDIIAYRNHLRETYQDNTVNSYMTALRRLFKYLKVNNLYDNLTIDIKGARYTNTPKKEVLSIDQVKNIYNSLTNDRDRALFGLMAGTGLRVCEISTALIEDLKVYNNENVLFVLGKKRDSKCEYVKISDKILGDLKKYIGNRTSGYIFISNSNNNKNGGLSIRSLRTIIKKIFKDNGIDKDTISCHSLRRTFATIMYQQGKSVYDIQQVLRHASSNTTIRYINAITRNQNDGETVVSNAIFGK